MIESRQPVAALKAVTAVWNGTVIAESDHTVVLEGNHYFPPDSIIPIHFRDSDTSTHCPWKGDASYKHVVVDDEVNEDACWYYPDPTPEAVRIRDYYAFWRGVQIVRSSDDERRRLLAETVRRISERTAALGGADAATNDELATILTDSLTGTPAASLLYALPPGFVQRLGFFNFYNSTTASFRTDGGRVLHAVNPTFSWAFSHITPVEGKRLGDMLSELGMSREDVMHVDAQLSSHGWVNIERLDVEKDGEIRSYALDAVAARHGDLESLAGVQGQFIDITDQVLLTWRLEEHAAELERLRADLEELVAERTEKLQRALRYIHGIIDNLTDGLLVTGPDGKIELANPALLSMFGVEGEVAGSPVSEAFGEALSALTDSVRGDAEPDRAELSITGGGVGMAHASPVRLGDAAGDGAPVSSVTVVRDVTFEKEVDRMKTEFITGVSHELRTPLTSILGFAKLIEKRIDAVAPVVGKAGLDEARDLDVVRENLDIIVSEAERLSRLVNDVLDVAKMEAGAMEWRVAPLAIEDVVSRAADATRALFVDSPLRLALHVEEELPRVHGDEDHLVQVVINLISNAVKFASEGVVECRATLQEDAVLVSVSDSGIGIAPEDVGNIFAKFTQVGHTLSDKPVGTGLGLTVCRRIVEHHGGRIWVESDVGVGTTMYFTVPLGQAAPSASSG